MKRKARIPYITLGILGVSLVAAFLVAFSPDLISEYGFRSDKPLVVPFFVNVFLHANVVHLLGNLLFLAAVGVAVEIAAGWKRYLAVIGFGSYLGVLVHWMVTSGLYQPVPLVGISGGIAGCAAYYGWRYSKLRVAIAPNTSASVGIITVVWVVLQGVGAFIHIGDPYGSMAFWAHLGGAAAGILLSVLFKSPDLKEVELGHEVLDRMNERGPAALLHAAQRHLDKNPKDPKGLQDAAKAYALMDEPDGESKMILKLLEVELPSEHPALLKRLAHIHRLAAIPTLKRMMVADEQREALPELSIVLLQSVLKEDSNSVYRPDALLSLATLARESSPEVYEKSIAELSDHYPLHAATEIARTRGWLA